jgi:TolA-binding protein
LANARTRLAAFETSYPQSAFIDNARYYLGRSFFDAGLAAAAADAAAFFSGALAPFERVLLTMGSAFEDDARFYHARSRYHLGNNFSLAIAEFVDLITLFPASQYADNALLFEMRSNIALGDCPVAATVLTKLTTDYPASLVISLAQADFAADCQ